MYETVNLFLRFLWLLNGKKESKLFDQYTAKKRELSSNFHVVDVASYRLSFLSYYVNAFIPKFHLSKQLPSELQANRSWRDKEESHGGDLEKINRNTDLCITHNMHKAQWTFYNKPLLKSQAVRNWSITIECENNRLIVQFFTAWWKLR